MPTKKKQVLDIKINDKPLSSLKVDTNEDMLLLAKVKQALDQHIYGIVGKASGNGQYFGGKTKLNNDSQELGLAMYAKARNDLNEYNNLGARIKGIEYRQKPAAKKVVKRKTTPNKTTTTSSTKGSNELQPHDFEKWQTLDGMKKAFSGLPNTVLPAFFSKYKIEQSGNQEQDYQKLFDAARKDFRDKQAKA